MTEQATIGAFAHKLAPLENWTAWKLGERESYPIAIGPALSSGEAARQALFLHCFNRGDTLAVLYTHAGRNKRTLWLYTIKQSTKNGTWRAAHDGGRSVFQGNLEPHLICETAVAAFAPVEPFDAFRDDPVGRDLTLVEQR